MISKTRKTVTIEYDKKKKRWKAKPGTLELKCKENDGVVFNAKGSKVVFFFPEPEIFNPVTPTLTVNRGKSEELVLSGTIGEFFYAAFCLADKEFAEGDSPPMMIIE
ncbi:MAG: hypothetical protein FJ215_12440 [Ignavibacteria bacterium]|nr:hypothetical protein [Ignavibacteria bacterium]